MLNFSTVGINEVEKEDNKKIIEYIKKYNIKLDDVIVINYIRGRINDIDTADEILSKIYEARKIDNVNDLLSELENLAK